MNQVRVLAALIVAFACMPICGAQQAQKKVALTANSTVSSGEVLNALKKKGCADVILTGNSTNADYMLEVDQKKADSKIDMWAHDTEKRLEYTATVFSLKGDVLFQSKSHVYSITTLNGVVLDACKALGLVK